MAIVNIITENDADFFRPFVYQTVDGSPIDLTGNTLRMGIRHHASDAHEDLLLTTENGALIITDAVNGQFSVLITQAQLLALHIGTYEHSLIRTVSGYKFRIWSGTLTNNPGASR